MTTFYSPPRPGRDKHYARDFLEESSFQKSPTQGLSKLWQADMVEHRMREMVRSRKRDVEPAPLHMHTVHGQRSAYTHATAPLQAQHAQAMEALMLTRAERDTALQQQRSLQLQVAHEREENRNLESEVIAFKQRMEAAIGSFEEIVEQAGQEKAALLSQLQAAQQEAENARRNATKPHAVKVAPAQPHHMRNLSRLHLAVPLRE
jgi:chromosome segregation ATPase